MMGITTTAGRSSSAVEQGLLRPASAIAAGGDPGAARRFLELLRAPETGCTELRVLRAGLDRQGNIRRAEDVGLHQGGSTLAGWYDDIERLTAQARRLRSVSVYVTINPVRLDLLARCDNRLGRVRHTTRDSDVVCLRWLYLDIDPVRPPDISSSDSELAAAVARRDAILGDCPELSASAVWGRSGNGGWVLIRLPDYPNDPAHRTLVIDAVGALSRVYSDSSVVIDTATVNPARLIGLPGTLKAKGSPRPERPWRFVTLDGIGCRVRAPRRDDPGPGVG
jgi:hypothetical protein